ncbi:MAG: hypothetical protein ACQESK_00475 [Bacteroidota bacterium]
MKFIFTTLLLFMFFSCSTKKEVANEHKTADIEFKGCPEEGQCFIELIEDSEVSLIKDGTGENYPNIISSKDFNVYKITYEKETMEGVADDEYNEIFYFQIAKDSDADIKVSDEQLKELNFIYGRICRCPGETGYEYVEEGRFELNQNKDGNFHLYFDIEAKIYPILMNQFEYKGKL